MNVDHSDPAGGRGAAARPAGGRRRQSGGRSPARRSAAGTRSSLSSEAQALAAAAALALLVDHSDHIYPSRNSRNTVFIRTIATDDDRVNLLSASDYSVTGSWAASHVVLVL
jgi:hypothetical protein